MQAECSHQAWGVHVCVRMCEVCLCGVSVYTCVRVRAYLCGTHVDR